MHEDDKGGEEMEVEEDEDETIARWRGECDTIVLENAWEFDNNVMLQLEH